MRTAILLTTKLPTLSSFATKLRRTATLTLFAIAACLLFPAIGSGEVITWKPGAEGDWFDAAHWTAGKAPAEGDDVVIRDKGSKPLVARSTPALGTLTLDQTLVLSGAETTLNAANIKVESGGTITLPGPFKEKSALNRIAIHCTGDLTIDAGGSINADAKGYAGGEGHQKNEDPTSAGFGPGAGGFPKVWGASAGGSHGGLGGTPAAVATYDTVDAPSNPGSGGGGGNGAGGAGGGAIDIKAKHVLVHGAITASGGSATGSTYGGGGSGGSIFIKCETISGGPDPTDGGAGQPQLRKRISNAGGLISADGGTGSIYAGGGGGGRIAVDYNVDAPAKKPPSQLIFSAVGGANGIGPHGTEEPKNFGESGTLAFTSGRVPGTVLPGTGQVVAIGGAAQLQQESTAAFWMPWRTNRPIGTVTKELAREHARPNIAAMLARYYVGPKTEMVELQAVEARDDVHTEQEKRWSTDNGRTWSAPMSVPGTLTTQAGIEVWEGGGSTVFDTRSNLLVEAWLRQIQVGNVFGDGICNNFTYHRVSKDFGRTWSEPRQLRYEAGDAFDPKDPRKPSFLLHNQAYYGSTVLAHSNGTLILCASHVNVPDDPENDRRTWKMGSICFIGRWNAAKQDYDWEAGQRVKISPDVSSRGLMEPALAELSGGRVFVLWRGSNTATTPGRKWVSVSTDGGRTMAQPREMLYDDGSRFYSPSSSNELFRHSVTKKLYWLGNITAVPPGGNSPRFPLVIAEVDEEKLALKKQTVTVIDDRDPNQHSFEVQFSNVTTYEDRETHKIEMRLTTYGQQHDQKDWLSADSFHYALTLSDAK